MPKGSCWNQVAGSTRDLLWSLRLRLTSRLPSCSSSTLVFRIHKAAWSLQLFLDNTEEISSIYSHQSLCRVLEPSYEHRMSYSNGNGNGFLAVNMRTSPKERRYAFARCRSELL